MKKVMITGANGFMGQHLAIYLQMAGFDVLATGKGPYRIPFEINYSPLDISAPDQVRDFFRQNHSDIIIHTAAMSKPDECNNDRALCLHINVEATKFLINESDGHFVYISTDFIFGENGPHAEMDVPNPLNIYGESKLIAEKSILDCKKKSTIVRPVFMYGKIWEGMKPTFLHWVKKNLEEEKKIKVTSDQWRTPTYINDICKGIESILSKEATGVYHLAGKDIITPYEMAMKTAELLSLDTSLIEKVTADTFPEPVKRARRSGLMIDKARKDLGYEPVSFEDGVRLTFG